MNSKSVYLSMLLTMVAPIASMADNSPQSGATNGYELVWSDEFNGTTLNTKAWNIEVNGNGGGNNELQYYRSENVSVGTEPTSGENCMIITSKKESFGGKSFTSGRVNSMGKVAFKHGKIEARIMMPKTANGLWPAFWMMGNDMNAGVSWPYCGEMDILEAGNSEGISAGTQEKYIDGALHWGPYSGGNHPMYAKGYTSPYSLQDGQFHLFTLIWDDNKVSMYIDLDKNPGESPYFEMTISDMSAQNSAGRYFHKQFFLLFNVAVGGSVTGIYNDNGITALNNGDAKMYVDYVRAYQLSDAKDYTTPDGSTTPKGPTNPIDNNTKLGDYGSLSLHADSTSTFDFTNSKDYVLVDVSPSVKEAMAGKIKADYSVDDTKNFLYIWENTYASKTSKGINSFGQNETYNDFTVGSVGWSGLGYASPSGSGKDLSMLDDDYFLHFSMHGTDSLVHNTNSVWIGNAKFSIGASAFNDNGNTYKLLGDYKRDGRWCSFDIPVKMLKALANPLFPDADGGSKAYIGNVFAVLSGGISGTEVQFDNIFFYKNPTKTPYVPITDNTTALGDYGYKSLDDNGNTTFNFKDGYDYVLVDVSPSVKEAMGSNVKADYTVDDTKNFLYVWSNTYTSKASEGINSFGQTESFNDFTVNSVGWSGLGYASSAGNGKDLSMLDNTYYLHISLKGNDVIKHASHAIGVGSAKFTLGEASIDGSVMLGDFRRDGNWYSFDIPFSVIKNLASPVFKDADGGVKTYIGNVVSLLSGGISGTELQYDNVFFFKKHSNTDQPQDSELGKYGSKSLNDKGVSSFDFANTKDYILVDVGAAEKEAMSGKIKADYTVDDTKNFLYVWNDTYTAKTSSGVNSFGQAESYNDFTVNSVGWSGLGFASSAGNGKDLSMIDDTYYLHFAMKGSDVSAHAPHAIGVGDAHFTIGNTTFVDNTKTYMMLGDYKRDGEWYSFDIPMSVISKLANPVFINPSTYINNVFSVLSGGTSGTELQFDGVFFYRNVTTGIHDVNTQSENRPTQIFDISGRKVRDMNRCGIYIIKTSIGTKKIVVK